MNKKFNILIKYSPGDIDTIDISLSITQTNGKEATCFWAPNSFEATLYPSGRISWGWNPGSFSKEIVKEGYEILKLFEEFENKTVSDQLDLWLKKYAIPRGINKVVIYWGKRFIKEIGIGSFHTELEELQNSRFVIVQEKK